MICRIPNFFNTLQACAANEHESSRIFAVWLTVLPEDYEKKPDQRWPFVLFLHGVGERGNNLEQLKVHGIPRLVDEGKDYPFIAASPQLRVGVDWKSQLAALTSLIKTLESKYRIDANRIYVTGISLVH